MSTWKPSSLGSETFLSRVEQVTRDIMPSVRQRLAETGGGQSSRPVVSTTLRKRKRSVSPPPSPPRGEEEDDDDEEVEESDAHSDDGPRLPLSVAGPSITVPHKNPLDGTSKYLSLDEAVEDTMRIIAFYRARVFRGGERCFLCEYGNKTYDNSPDFGCRPYVALLRLIKLNYPHMTLEELGECCAEYYLRTIEAPMEIYIARHNLDRKAFSLPSMTGEMFARHIGRHNFDPIVMIGESIRRTDEMLDVVQNRIVKRSDDSIDHKAVDSFAKLQKLKISLMTTPRERLLFQNMAGESLELDSSKMAALGNMRRVESLLMNKKNTIGGQSALDATASTGDAQRSNFTLDARVTVATSAASRDDMRELNEMLIEEEAMDIDD